MSKVEELESILPQLPEEAVEELLLIAQRWQQLSAEVPTVTPSPLRGVWEGVDISLEEFKQLRREMWAGLGDERNLECDGT